MTTNERELLLKYLEIITDLKNEIIDLQEENQTYRQNYTKLIGENELIKKIGDLQEENKRLKEQKAKALDYIKMHCEIIRNEEKGYDEIGKVEAMPIYYILEGEYYE